MPLSMSLALLASMHAGMQHDFIVPPNTQVAYDTTRGPLLVRDFVIGDGGVLRVHGPNPFVLRASDAVRIEGTLDLSGFDARDVVTLNTGNVPERGGEGGPGGGAGGSSSTSTNDSTPTGDTGSDALGELAGGAGGEAGYSALGQEARRPGGGGGGVLALDQPVSDDPNDDANLGLVAGCGVDGDALSNGALSGTPPARGGAKGTSVFVDGDPTNDFWGFARNANGELLQGELHFPFGGRGGGGGGDAIPSDAFPSVPWNPGSDEKGGAGGGGGGLGFVFAPTVVLGPQGAIRADGGAGGRGENTFGLNSIGGNGGGGSGGSLVVIATSIDLSQASDDALSALGGAGAVDFNGTLDGDGGNGGPGVIQLHTPEAAGVRLPAGKSLDELSSPDAWSLLLPQ